VGIIKAVSRSCLIATSIEAKKLGIKTGMAVAEAKKLSPGIILVPADFEKYEDITYRFIKICKTYSPMCEVFSLDECFIDVTETEKFFGGAVNIALAIKDRLRNEIGDYMSCSVGISENKLLAKLASSKIKADGLFVIDRAIALDIFIESLADGGVQVGLSRDVALKLALQTVYGAARMALESGKHLGELRDEVTSPGGTTIAGLYALEKGGMRGTVMEAVLQATRRSQTLGKGES